MPDLSAFKDFPVGLGMSSEAGPGRVSKPLKRKKNKNGSQVPPVALTRIEMTDLI